jgi:hypothetical protein
MWYNVAECVYTMASGAPNGKRHNLYKSTQEAHGENSDRDNEDRECGSVPIGFKPVDERAALKGCTSKHKQPGACRHGVPPVCRPQQLKTSHMQVAPDRMWVVTSSR